MEYLVFPFGKYKGEKLEDLPSTYIVLALEKFDLPDELKKGLNLVLHSRIGIHELILQAGNYGESSYENAYGVLLDYAYTIISHLEEVHKNKNDE